ncbi:MAG TPA: hypothetical protein VH280_13205 [Verrucomicrobiae bacterium]|nr:hypothetical protein [Verrucomicrobiae bacterium]
MKKAFLLLVSLLIIAIAVLIWLKVSNSRKAVALPPANTIVRIYYAGAANLAADTNSIAFTNIFCSSQARGLESQTFDKLSRAPGTWFKAKLPPNTPDGSAQLRPLLDDFLTSEWVLEMRDATSSPEYSLAIQLNDARAQLWETNLRTLLETWTGIKATNVAGGWDLKKDMPPNMFRLVRTTNWLVIGCGQDELPLSDAWVSREQSRAREQAQSNSPEDHSLTVGALSGDTNWVSAKVDWPRLAQIFPVFAKFDLPVMQMQVVGRNGLLLTSGTFDLSQPLAGLTDWEIPTNLIRQPITSFTGVRWFAPWLERQSWANWLKFSPVPDQAFIWSLGSSPFQTYVAIPVTNSTAELAQLDQNLTTNTNWETHLTTHFALVRTNNRIFLRNVPLMTPEIRALKEPSGDFLLADLFANPPFGKGPTDLFQAAGRTNLLFYHWEVTSERLKELVEPTQLTLMLTRHRESDPNAAAGQWLAHIGPSLGNSVTEVTQTGPEELQFRRSALAGLTAFELLALANWLESPNFPGWDLSLPARRFPPYHTPKTLNPSAVRHPTPTPHPPALPSSTH